VSMAGELGRWPWPRSAYRDLLDFFALAGAQAFAFDILFTEQQDVDKNNPSDQALVEATRRAGNTVHAMQLLRSIQLNKKRSLPEEFKRLHALESSSGVLNCHSPGGIMSISGNPPVIEPDCQILSLSAL